MYKWMPVKGKLLWIWILWSQSIYALIAEKAFVAGVFLLLLELVFLFGNVVNWSMATNYNVYASIYLKDEPIHANGVREASVSIL